jgi:nucleoredoxin
MNIVARPLTSVIIALLFVLAKIDDKLVFASVATSVDVKDDVSVTELVDDITAAKDTMNSTLVSTNDNAIGSNNATKLQPNAQTTAPVDRDPVQIGPLIDIFGPKLLTLEMVNDTSAELRSRFTSDALRGKKVIGLYFSADWCGPCRQFTPDLVKFYHKINNRRGKKDEFEIVWISRCRDVRSFGQYFTHMGGWVALPPEEAMGERGSMLSQKFRVKGIPTLVLLDDLGEVITLDGRNKIPQDKAGIGFPWRNPIATIYVTVVPRTLRLMIRSQITSVTETFLANFKQLISLKKKQSRRNPIEL